MMDMGVSENTWGGPTVEMLILALEVWIKGSHHYHIPAWIDVATGACKEICVS
jgi:hypothetical protein